MATEMAYMRGNLYIWGSDSHMHIWQIHNASPSALDFMRASSWGVGGAETYGAANLSAVALTNEQFDELVVMHHARMTAAEREAAEERAIARWAGNGGCIALQERRDGATVKGED